MLKAPWSSETGGPGDLETTLQVVSGVRSICADLLGLKVTRHCDRKRFLKCFVANRIQIMVDGQESPDIFEYKDKGTMATIGRRRAIAWIGRIQLSGIIAWWSWLLVHLITLIGFRHKLLVLTQWFYNYVTFSRGARISISSKEDDRHAAVEESSANPRPV